MMKEKGKKTEGFLKKDYGRVLGLLEQDIMETLWASGALSGKEVHAGINKKRAIALTTVLTVLDRLVKKGLVEKTKGTDVFLFRTLYSKDEFAMKISGALFRDIIEISTSSAAASFVDMLADADPDELKRLEALIEKKRRELKG